MIAIDEISLGRVRKYVTLVIDLQSGRIIWVGQGRGGLALKEELGLLWEQEDWRAAWNFMRDWCAKARSTGIKQLQAMAKTLMRHGKGILSYYKTRMTTRITGGKMEGINRKIRGLLTSASGFRDADFLKLRLYALDEAKFKIAG